MRRIALRTTTTTSYGRSVLGRLCAIFSLGNADPPEGFRKKVPFVSPEQPADVGLAGSTQRNRPRISAGYPFLLVSASQKKSATTEVGTQRSLRFPAQAMKLKTDGMLGVGIIPWEPAVSIRRIAMECEPRRVVHCYHLLRTVVQQRHDMGTTWINTRRYHHVTPSSYESLQ